MAEIDCISLAQKLIRCPSVTPTDAGAMDALEQSLKGLGFVTNRLPFGEVDNLYAQFGEGTPNFCFAGHTDVVPPGSDASWEEDPFGAEIRDGALWGRGAADMKSAIAAFVAASSRIINRGAVKGAISLLITGDEEGPAVNGTRKVLDWLRENNITLTHCLVGEPSNPDMLGDMIKVGRRGSINCWLTVTGLQGHVAYPHRANNPIPALLRKLLHLSETTLDEGYERFDPSCLQITDIHVGNQAHNVIPEKAAARFNIRFNPNWTGASIETWLREQLDRLADEIGAKYELDCVVSGESFLTTDTKYLTIIADCVEQETGRRPEYSTTGGTSDARFIKDYAPVAEFGLVGETMHKANERVAVDDIETLATIYENIIERYFSEYSSPS